MKMAETSAKDQKTTLLEKENCSSQVICPFTTVFSKDLNCRYLKARVCLEKGIDWHYIMYHGDIQGLTNKVGNEERNE